MRKQNAIGRGAALFAAAVIMIWPALLTAQATGKNPPEKPQVVDMGPYRVSAPPGKGWKVEVDKNAGTVTFTQVKGTGLLGALLPFSQARGTFLTVRPIFLDSWKWGMSEEAAENAVINQVFVQGDLAMAPDNTVEKGEVVLKDKKLRFMKFQTVFWDQEHMQNFVADNLDYVYFPPTFKKSHIALIFSSQFSRTTNWELFKNPGQGPVAAVIDSLEIVDPLKAVPGPDGDLLRAAAAGDLEAARQAIDKGAKANVTASQMIALSAAAYYGHREIAELLLGQGAEINKGDDEAGITPLIAAISGGEPETADLLVQRGADVNLRTKRGLSALMWAADIEHSGLVSLLIAHGADVNAKSIDGRTSLMITADRTGTTEIAQLLTAAGADVNAQMNDGKNALMMTINKKNTDMAKFLLDKNADVNLKTETGWTALMVAALRGETEIVEALIKKGADMNPEVKASGRTALMIAVAEGKPEIAKILIEAGADVNVKMKEGGTALIGAAEMGQTEVVKLLIEKGADVNAKTAKNQTALKLAKRKKYPDIVRMLMAAGAKG
jgi:ankyrin repeat protein